VKTDIFLSFLQSLVTKSNFILVEAIAKGFIAVRDNAIMEAVVANGNDLIAYIIVVAEEYAKLMKYNPDEAYRWDALAETDENFLKKILSKVNIEFTSDDPYPNQREMMYDIFHNNNLKIYSTLEDESQEGSHPAISNKQNDKLRAVHDFMGHYLPNVKMFRKYIKQHNIKSPDDEMFKKLRFGSHSFTVRGEMNTFLSHAKTMPPEAVPALFTEIIGQICTYFVTGNYTENKADIMEGVDFKNIGNFTSPELNARKKHYSDLLSNPNVESFETKLPGHPIIKDEIRWNLISHGEGVTHKRKKGA